MNGTVVAVLFVLAFVLVVSMSSKGEKLRALLLVGVVLLLGSTPTLVVVHDTLLELMLSFG